MANVLVGLDRDGTINKDSAEYFGKNSRWREELELYDGVIEGIKLLNQFDCIIVVASNQAGVARGYYDTKRVEEINTAIDFILSRRDARVHSWQYCPYVGKSYVAERKIENSSNRLFVLDDNDPRLDLRKPRIGMLRQGVNKLGLSLDEFKRIYFVGDHAIDIQTGLNAGGTGILIDNGSNKDEIEKMMSLYFDSEKSFVFADSFYQAAEWIVDDIMVGGS